MKQIHKQFTLVTAGFFLVAGFLLYKAYGLKPKITISLDPVSITNSASGIKQAVAAATVNPAYNEIIAPEGSIKVPVLMYHRIGTPPDPAAADLTVSVEDFDAELKFFKDSGYNSVSVQQIYDAFENGTALPNKPIVFTFDDGYKDAFDNAIPVLLEYNFTGTFAVATALLGRPTYGNWDDVLAAQKSGMEIVSHTENHLDLTNPIYSDADLKREIYDAKQVLESKLGQPINFFIYPYGRNNPRVEAMVQDAGYKMAFTTAYGMNLGENSLLAEPRVRVHGQNGVEKLIKLFSPAQQTATAPLNP